MAISGHRADLDFFTKLSALIADDPDKFLLFEEFIRLVKNTYPSRILYGLLKLEFSASWELSTLLAISDNKTTRHAMSDLIQKGIVIPIYKTSEKYDFILKFWKTIYKRSSHPAAFFKLHSNWIQFIKNNESILSENFKASDPIDFKGIDMRMNRYRQYCEKEKAALQAIENLKKNAIGKCENCDEFIFKNHVKNTDYYKYPIGFICHRCWEYEKDQKKRTKWILAK